jgi:hypothetical protein
MPQDKPSRKGHNRPAPYQRKEKACPAHRDAPRTAAKSDLHTGRKNLTLGDWVVVFEFVDQHPNLPQRAVVEHFRALKDGSLYFSQETLSQKLKTRLEIEK